MGASTSFFPTLIDKAPDLEIHLPDGPHPSSVKTLVLETIQKR